MREVWLAVDDVAAVLCRSSVVRTHAAAMGTWRQIDPPDHVRQVLHEDPVAEMWDRHPLVMGLLYADSASAEPMAAAAEGREWLRGALQVAFGFGRIIEWLRSRLPGYPRLLVPQLLPGSVRAQGSGFFFGPGFPWWQTFRSEAPQFHGRVNVETFELDPEEAERLREAVARVPTVLTKTAEFRDFAAAYTALDNAMVAELRSLARSYRDQTRDDDVDAIEPDNLMRRHRLREAVMASVLADASEAVRPYLVAFERVDGLISAVARAIENLVVFGPPEVAGAIADGTWRAGSFGYRVRLATKEDASFMVRLGMVEVTAEVERLAGIVVTDSQSISIGTHMTALSAAITGELLPASAGTLRSGPAR